MNPETTDPNLLLLALNLSDSDPDEAAAPQSTTNTNTTTGPTTEYQPTRADRSALSEEAFLALKQSYRPKIENGNLHTQSLPLPPTTPLPKPLAQSLLHAAEELYFFRRYHSAVTYLTSVLNNLDSDNTEEGTTSNKDGGKIDAETRRLLGYYLARCQARVEEIEKEGGQRDGLEEKVGENGVVAG
ncbi:hypothetical protein C8A05DRAFT_14226 [Staphylotrichum tortipilum]|uniref:Uncharacterized protein n=1 Tax=Staphylotrichum tortipilum TaxID=2831512 RepID=A0AAN6RV31_9PEZI|nr:hypothetical protein C8A05DRAFT_14226 [Staphylotrichum longicolle]